MNDADGPLLTLYEAARRFGLSVWALRAEVGQGRIQIQTIGRRHYTTAAAVERMLASSGVETTALAPSQPEISIAPDMPGSLNDDAEVTRMTGEDPSSTEFRGNRNSAK